MKGNLKPIAIAGIIILFVLSWYTLIKDTAKTTNEYQGTLALARENRQKGLEDDALDAYAKTLQLEDTKEIRSEIADYYKEINRPGAYMECCESMISKDPYDPEGYERLANHYLETEDYISCYEVLDRANKRGIYSDILEALRMDNWYKFDYMSFGYEDIGIFSGNSCAVKPYEKDWGYVDSLGKNQLGRIYQKAGIFNNANGYAVVKREDEYRIIDRTGRDKSLNQTGNVIEDAFFYSDDLMAVKYNGKYHFCDFSFKEVFGSYDYAGSFNYGLAPVKEGSKWYFVTKTGEKMNGETYDDIKFDEKGIAFRNGVAFVKKGDSYILINTEGKQVGSLEFKDARAFTSDGPAAVSNGTLWGFVDAEGNLVADYRFGDARSFVNGYAAVSVLDDWGYISQKDYEIRIEPQFTAASDFTENSSAFVQMNNGWDMIQLYSGKFN